METARDILVMIALGAVSALSIYLIVVLVSVRRILTSLRDDLQAVSTRAIPVLDNLNVITARLRSVAEAIGDHVDGLRGSLDAFRDAAGEIADLERRVKERIEEPLLEIADTLAALFRNAQALIDRIPFIGRSRAQ